MGTYKGGSTRYRSISDNVAALKTSYSYSNGYFGIKGQGGTHTRNITSSDPVKTAKSFYDTASYGGIESHMKNGKGYTTNMADGTVISYRKTSTSDGTSVVEINIRKSANTGELKYQKIHFVKED
ncbi:MAG: hypothetical protein IJQ50_07195 [Clostridia bacterium]|nr:hypothetical protein [Clostridia bacterium]